MAIAYAKFFPPTVLTVSPATLYIVPAQPTTNLFRGGRIRFTNTTGAAATATAYAVPVGGSAGPGNAFASVVTVPANSYVDVDVPIMAAGDFIQALSPTATAITAQPMAGGVFS